LAFETVRTADEFRLAVTGELDMATGPSLEETALALLRDRPQVLSLDMRGVTFCDSSGIACLIRVQRAVSEAGGRLELRHVHGLVRRVLDLAGVSGVLGVRDETEDRQDLSGGAADTSR
jgi:anti-sigma B factor antagonist